MSTIVILFLSRLENLWNCRPKRLLFFNSLSVTSQRRKSSFFFCRPKGEEFFLNFRLPVKWNLILSRPGRKLESKNSLSSENEDFHQFSVASFRNLIHSRPTAKLELKLSLFARKIENVWKVSLSTDINVLKNHEVKTFWKSPRLRLTTACFWNLGIYGDVTIPRKNPSGGK